MTRIIAVLTLATLPLLGCRGTANAPPMAGMQHTEMEDTGTNRLPGRGPVHLTDAQARAIGVTFAVVQQGVLERTVRTVGQVAPAESQVAEVTTKIDGFVDRLYVNATGMPVRRGEPLLDLYSPMLVAAQEELLTARRLAASVDSSARDAWRNAQTLVEAARGRLLYWDISPDQVDRLEQTGQVTKTLTLRAPFDGVVLEKMVVQGQAVEAGMKLYRLADLSAVWIEGDVFEQDLAVIRVGAPARITLEAYPGREFRGRVAFIWPVVDEQARAGRVRVEIKNPVGALKPGMYATLLFDARLGSDVINVPAEAVVMTGERNLVFVQGSDGMLTPREVTVGGRAGDRLQVLRGLAPGERVVSSANFLVDAESRLGAGDGMSPMPGMKP